ncbi:hypothetical protein HPP92_021489 [Vanilla planifolia]|uniref:Uncharacterized protein n=1 Tax=Vanilla planifolia TaxID=51239 RepID=A0A835PXC4_VANPL|nr:hypothetical protein HPP92_021851 [Vanilla planifolia]KAG0463013.1 hypothetical protein HPP92_021489 [Vanilla planifolia]
MEKMPLFQHVFFLDLVLLLSTATTGTFSSSVGLVNVAHLQMFVDELPEMPKVRGFRVRNGTVEPAHLAIGMYDKTWKFHRDLPPSKVFAFGISRDKATVPGPTIEALQGVPTRITWYNYLPSRHILPWDPTIPVASPSSPAGGIPTVVHLHGGIQPPSSDGHGGAWFTSNLSSVGPTFASSTNAHPNVQDPGTLWYHDHALGLTRVNILAGLFGAYLIRSPSLESPLGLPSSSFERVLFLFDRSFRSEGSLFINSTGNNPSIHPQWQPEFFGPAIVVNGKVWPFLRVRRRPYRFRIINASNARFFRLSFSNSLRFDHIASDTVYLPTAVPSRRFLLAPSEIADVVVDFARSTTDSALLLNDAAYPYPTGDSPDAFSSRVMKFVIRRSKRGKRDPSWMPRKLLPPPPPPVTEKAVAERYIAMYEYESATGEPTHLYLNGRSFEEAATETPRSGTGELWHIINLTEDNHPLHIHLGLFVVMEQRKLVGLEQLKDCMMRINDAQACHVEDHAAHGRVEPVPGHESGWKNVFKMQPGFVTRIFVRFAMLRTEEPYPFDATAEPGYVYHCHILDHEDNAMMRPLKLLA